MNNTARLFLAVFLGTITSPHTAQAFWFDNHHHMESLQKSIITMPQAIQKASEAQGGIVISAELDDFGSEGIFYNIDILKDGERHELLVNAVTGEVILESDGWFQQVFSSRP